MRNFWNDLQKPIMCLAPMDDVTDTVFRQMVIECGRPDIFFTEFVNVEGLCSSGVNKVLTRLKFSKKEKPIIAQIWGLIPEHFYRSAKLIAEMGFDGVDINMGCPKKDVAARGTCAALIKNPTLAKEIILATKEGSGNLPVSVKTRIGYTKIQTEEWSAFLLSLNLDALIVHGRTAKEMSKVPAHWDEIGKVVRLRNQLRNKTIIIGNGDVMSLTEAYRKVDQYGVDGVMVGRGIFHNPWLFNSDIDPLKVTKKERLELLWNHTKLFNEIWGKTKDFNILKKFYKIYVSNFDGASNLRVQLMGSKTPEEVERILRLEAIQHQGLEGREYGNKST